MANVKWHGAALLAQVEGRLETALDVTARDIIDHCRKSMKETKSGMDVPAGKKRYGSSTGKRAKGSGTRRSAPGESPAVQTGRLWKSLAKDGPEGAYAKAKLWRRVGTKVPYGLWLELGTQHMAARPYLRPTLEAARPAADRNIRKAFTGW